MDKYIQKIMTKDGAKQIDYNALANLPMINQDDSVDVEKTINASNIVLEQSVEANSVISDTIIGTTVQGNVGEFENIYNKTDIDNKIDKINYDGIIVESDKYSGLSSNKGIKLHKVVGKTTQQTTNGYQLFDASKLQTKSAGGATVTNNGDGSFTVSGSGNLTENYINNFVLDNETSKSLVKSGTINLVATSTNPYVFVSVKNNDGLIGEASAYIDSTSSIELTSEQINSDGFYIALGFFGSKGKPIKTGTIKPMIYQDGDGTWEQFTGVQPAPNPDYPMPIENVEISKIISHGRQLFDSSKLSTKSAGGATVTNNGDGSFTVSGSGNLTENYINNFVLDNETSKSLVKSGTINLVATSTNPYVFVSVKNNDGLIGEASAYIDSTSSIELTSEQINSDGFYIALGFFGSKGKPIKTGTIKPMIYQDGDGTWEPFKHATVETSLKLAEGETYIDGEPTARKRKQITFNGSENWFDSNVGTTSDYYRCAVYLKEVKSIKLCNKLTVRTNQPHGNYEYVSGINDKVYIQIAKKRLSENSLHGFKTWLQSNPVTIECELATTKTETIKVPTIPSYSPHTNVWTDNQVPTDMEWELLANSDNSLQIEELEKKIEELQTIMLELKTKGVI